ncbi:hypothetical protein SAMN05421805_110127 [Saccharopolyspora antimicrobica]|uniref:Uncharacterized protein n=1 Tax=Saccharopolyspora antimicrobica TaxID=455193 RepID=A0A1I5F136_9PSEU|nr:hypothetical protein [Saccharopolyspora antimicrobica]RKT83627.1 hypothetical protein ATL45_1921 [Saccharopolyspora antimicrobica]SFO17339.1 hypothetical protein SAMN05421805_110127 [Saccharopolyspora antimicrobica]
MVREFPLPPRAEETGELIRKRLAEAAASSGTRETVTVEWNQQPLHVEVIDLPLSVLYFNPATHRIRAQRSYDPARDRVLTEDPFSAESQEYLAYLLQAEPADPSRRDPDFDALKRSLEDFNQTDPGLVTYQGILVNGNTRAAALREIGRQSSMRVGVLPESFTWADINAVELSLQLRNDRRRDYSYINRLLAMEEQAALGKSKEAIAKEFHVWPKTVEQERWILGEIRDQISRSQKSEGPSLRLIDFEDHQEKLKELHRAWLKAQSVDPDRADVLKELRFAAITLGFSKTDIRHIGDGAFHEEYLAKWLPEEFSTAHDDDEELAVPGLGVSLPGETNALAVARKINDEVLRAKAGLKASAEISAGEKEEAGDKLSEVREAFDRAIDQAGRDFRLRKRKQQAPERLRDASGSIDQCVAELSQARAARALDEDEFDEAIVNLKESLRRLARQAGRGMAHPGEGLSWLISAVSDERTV